MSDRPDDKTLRAVNRPRLEARQIDELIGLARGLTADNVLSQQEVVYLGTWLAANREIIDQPLFGKLCDQVDAVLADGSADAEECADLLSALKALAIVDQAPGELLKSTALPFSDPLPDMVFEGRIYCFTGTFTFGQRKLCEQAVVARGAACGSLTKKTHFLVVGAYATESWKHSSFGNKILQAVKWRDEGLPIAIVPENHWAKVVRA